MTSIASPVWSARPVTDPSIDRRRLTVAGERAMITGANEHAVATLAEAMQIGHGLGVSRPRRARPVNS